MSGIPPCVGKHKLFDSVDRLDHIIAKRICRECPLLAQCRERLAEVKRTAPSYGHPEGTWAGELLIDKVHPTPRVDRIRTRELRAMEEEMYTDADAARAHDAWVNHGDRSEWAELGERIYKRRNKRAQRARKKAA